MKSELGLGNGGDRVEIKFNSKGVSGGLIGEGTFGWVSAAPRGRALV